MKERSFPENIKAACVAHLSLPGIGEPFLDRVLAAIERLEREGEESARRNAEAAELHRRMEALLGQMQDALQEIRRRG